MALPKLPDPDNIFSAIDKMGVAIDKGLGFIDKVSNSLDKIGLTEEPLRPSETQIEAPSEEKPTATIKTAVESGTACTLCCSEHFDEAANTLKEANRMVPTEGLTSPEIRKRLRHARGELDVMERFDLAPEEVAKLPPDEQGIATWAAPESRSLRHMINSIKTIDDLKEVTKKAAEVANEFDQRLVKCRPNYFETQGASSELPPEIEALRGMVEERKNAR